jgi:hypothetical protein
METVHNEVFSSISCKNVELVSKVSEQHKYSWQTDCSLCGLCWDSSSLSILPPTILHVVQAELDNSFV